MRYHNQTPQVTALLEKIEEQEKVIKSLKYDLEIENSKYFFLYQDLKIQVDVFNAMPWYMKMFYKFNI